MTKILLLILVLTGCSSKPVGCGSVIRLGEPEKCFGGKCRQSAVRLDDGRTVTVKVLGPYNIEDRVCIMTTWEGHNWVANFWEAK